jgi:antitoxin MazE
MQIQIQKWGNSFAIRIPKSFAQQINVQQGSYIDLSTEEGKLIAKPLDEKKYSLEQLLARVTEQNLHSEIDTGDAIGKEIW